MILIMDAKQSQFQKYWHPFVELNKNGSSRHFQNQFFFKEAYYITVFIVQI